MKVAIRKEWLETEEKFVEYLNSCSFITLMKLLAQVSDAYLESESNTNALQNIIKSSCSFSIFADNHMKVFLKGEWLTDGYNEESIAGVLRRKIMSYCHDFRVPEGIAKGVVE